MQEVENGLFANCKVPSMTIRLSLNTGLRQARLQGLSMATSYVESCCLDSKLTDSQAAIICRSNPYGMVAMMTVHLSLR